MSAPYNSVPQKCEQAFVALLGTQAAPVYAGIASTTKAAPCVICCAIKGVEDFPQSGNYKVTFKVIVKSMAESDPALEPSAILAHQALCASVFDWCKDSNLPADLTAAAANATPVVADFCVQGAIDKGWEALASPDGDAWVESMELELYACASNLS